MKTISNNMVYGTRIDYICPICDEIEMTTGDVANPTSLMCKGNICQDCKQKLKKLMGK